MITKILWLISIFSCSLYSPTIVQPAELKFYSDFDLALKLAAEEDKDVFVYVGRGYSKSERRLDSLFLQEEVIDLIHDRYIPVRLKDLPDVRFIKAYTRQQYPVLMFFTSDGEKSHEITFCCGSYTKESFLDEALYASTQPLPRKEHLQKNFKKNKNDPVLLKELLELAKRYGDEKLANKVLDQYAKIYQTESEDEWMNLVLENVASEDSKLFEILLDHKDDLEKEYGVMEIQSKILGVLSADIKAKMDFIDVDNFMSRLIKKVNDHEIDIEIEYLMQAAAKRKYTSLCGRDRVKSDSGEFAYRMLKSYEAVLDNNILTAVLWDIASHSQNRLHLKLALEHLENIMQEVDTYSLQNCRSVLLYKLDNEEGANELSALLEERAIELKQKAEKDCSNVLVYRAKFLRMK